MENTMFRNLFVAIPCVLAFACGASDQTGSGAADADATAIQHDSGSDLEASGGLGAPDGTDTLSPAQLAGQWVSPVCEAYDDGAGGKNYLTRDFTLTESSWNLVFTAFGDEACSYPLFSGEIEGPYALTGPSDAIADAVDRKAQTAATQNTLGGELKAHQLDGSVPELDKALRAVELTADRAYVDITIPVEEGPRFRIREFGSKAGGGRVPKFLEFEL